MFISVPLVWDLLREEFQALVRCYTVVCKFNFLHFSELGVISM